MKKDEIKFFGTYTVYEHISNITNQVFYVGLGKNQNFKKKRNDKLLTYRPNQIFDKNKKWHEIAKDGYTINIVSDNLTKNEAYELERELINKYGKRYSIYGNIINENATLVNIK